MPKTEGVRETVVPTVDLASLTVDEAVNALLPHLPEPIQEFLMEMEIQEGHSPTEYILGYIVRHYETGQLSYRPSEGQMASMGVMPDRPAARQAATPQVSTCEFCGKEFQPERPKQKYCPDVDDGVTESCGKQASRAEWRATHAYKYRGVQDDPTLTAAARSMQAARLTPS